MNITGVPDLLSNRQFRMRAGDLARQLAAAGEELTTGRRSDPAAAAGGDLRKLYLLETNAAAQAAFRDASSRVLARADAALNAVELMRSASEALGVDLVAATERGDTTSALRYADTARNAFGTAVRALNSRFAGRSLFAGSEVGGAALAGPNEILQQAFADVSGATSAADFRNQLRDWFTAPGGGYETFAYQGDLESTRMQVNENEFAVFDVTAQETPFRESLFGLALAVGVTEEAFGFTEAEQAEQLKVAAESLVGAQSGLIDISAHFGGLTELADTASDDAENMRFTFETRLNEIIGVDPYEAASRLSGIEGALDAALTVQSLTRNLNFTRYLQ